jgi:uncharacterized protein
MKKSINIILIIIFFLMMSYFILKIVLYKTTFDYKNQDIIDYDGIERSYITLSTREKIDIAFNEKNDDVLFVYFHGNRGRLSFIMNFLKDNYSFVSPSYPGYANSSGKPSVKNIYETVEKTKDFINDKFPNKKIYVIGHSLGSQSSFYYATIENNIKTLGILEGFDSVYNICRERLKKFGFLCFVSQNSFNAKKLAMQNTLPFTVISFHSPQDVIVSFNRGLNLYNKIKAKKKMFFTLPQGEHGNFDPRLVTDIMIDNGS